MLSHERLLEMLCYDPETGVFRWRVTRARTAHAGDRAGCQEKPWIKGRTTPWRCIHISGKTYQESRLAWLYMTGAWPERQIDHRDGNRLNNSWSNLREATPVQNSANRRKRSDNTTGFKGVVRRGRRFRAYAKIDGIRKYLGTFLTAEEAAQCYKLAVSRIHGEFAHHG